MDPTTAFVRSAADGAIEIVVNFGPLSGREATLAEVDRLARRLCDVAAHVRAHAVRTHDMGPEYEWIVHQVIVEASAPASEAEALRTISEAWATECAAERSLEPLGM
jgi:cell pole-organizing protein PopZ